MLTTTFSGVPLEFMKRVLLTKKGHCSRNKFPDELRSFAMTLQFYSSKAYEFVHKTFHLALPHKSQIRNWYTKVPAEPGFTKAAFLALQTAVCASNKIGHQVLCSLMLDEMAIKKQVQWDGKKFRGFVDLGNGIDNDDSLPLARDALVLMVVSINSNWKVPCGYFFIDGLSGVERSNSVRICLKKLFDVGVKVVSLTCDGPSYNFAMLSELGARLKPNNLLPWFPNPRNSCEKVYVLLDVCHMLKLLRNTLADLDTIVDGNNSRIRWQYLVELEKLQSREGLR